MARRLKRSFFARPAIEVAPNLIGKFLLRQVGQEIRVGRIVETEAYTGHDDRASHASRGLTPRNSIMFGPPGYAYVYLIYGMYNCLNIVCDRAGFPAAVLIRAIEPVENINILANGPGKLCRALEITREQNGADITRGTIWLAEESASVKPRLVATPRIGVDYAGDWAARPWRWVDADSHSLSRKL